MVRVHLVAPSPARLMVRTAVLHAVGRGSNPRWGTKYQMANYKKKRRHTYRYPTCSGGMKCRYDVVTDFSRNGKDRIPYRDLKKPQLYDDYGRVV